MLCVLEFTVTDRYDPVTWSRADFLLDGPPRNAKCYVWEEVTLCIYIVRPASLPDGYRMKGVIALILLCPIRWASVIVMIPLWGDRFGQEAVGVYLVSLPNSICLLGTSKDAKLCPQSFYAGFTRYIRAVKSLGV